VVDRVFARGFAISGVQNVVFCVAKRGGVVVEVWLETTSKLTRYFLHIYSFFCNDQRNDQRADATIVQVGAGCAEITIG
jgi:hypothetical protein